MQAQSGISAYTFAVQYKGTPLVVGQPAIDCTQSDVDQILIFMEPAAVSSTINVSCFVCACWLMQPGLSWGAQATGAMKRR